MNFRCLPMNLRAEDLASGILRERVKVGASLADVDPMNIDKSVSFVNGFLEIPLFFFFFFWSHSLWDLSSPIKD